MLVNLLNYLGTKKSREAFKRLLRLKAFITLLIGILGVILSWKLVLSDFQAGILSGFSVGVFSLSIRFSTLVNKPEAFEKYYIGYYDERNLKIRELASQLTLIFIAIFIIILAILFAFWDIRLSYQVLLTILIYLISFGSLMIRMILQRLV